MTETKKILILLGHPDNGPTFSRSVADKYQEAALEEGHSVTRVNIGELNFDPILHKGYKEIQPLEPDLLALQDTFREADHIVIIYPNWWNTMPAILKGLFDRMWLPGFAFNFDKETKKVIQRLKGKTARVIIASGTNSAFKTWWKYGDFTNEIESGILGFAGIKVKTTVFGPCEHVDDACKEKWLEKVAKMGTKGV